MAKIYLFGTKDIRIVPSYINEFLYSLMNQGHEFILKDRKGLDETYQRILSGIGALDRSTIYSMGNARNNGFGLKNKGFDTFYDVNTKTAQVVDRDNNTVELEVCNIEDEVSVPKNQEIIDFLELKMINESAIGIGLWDGNSKATFNTIQRFNIRNKPCYVYTIKNE